jgi:hypothetical protein
MRFTRSLIERAADPIDCTAPGAFASRGPSQQERARVTWRIDRCKQWCKSSSLAWPALTAFFKASPGAVPLSKALVPLSLVEPHLAPRWVHTLTKLLNHLEGIERMRVPHNHPTLVAGLAKELLNFAKASLLENSTWRDLSLLVLSRPASHAFDRYLYNHLMRLIRPCAAKSRHAAPWRRNVIPLISLLWEYPVLAKLLAIEIDNWRESVLELLTRFQSDRRMISRRLFKGIALGTIVGVQGDFSDPHCGGRTVAKVVFENGCSVFYKPRSGQGEELLSSLMLWLKENRFPVEMESMTTIDKKTYSWAREVRAEPCSSQFAVKRYFFRTGVILCLGHLLRTVDWHRDNLVAAGEFPVVLDAETLWHPHESGAGENKVGDISLFRVGLLPRSNGSAQKSSYHGIQPVHLGARVINPSERLDEIMRGFEVTWSFFLAAKERLHALHRFQRRAARMYRRRIYRSTATYARILENSLHPALLQDGMDRHLFLVLNCVRSGVPAPIGVEEVAQLAHLDIPSFTECGLCSSPGLAWKERARCRREITSSFSRQISSGEPEPPNIDSTCKAHAPLRRVREQFDRRP